MRIVRFCLGVASLAGLLICMFLLIWFIASFELEEIAAGLSAVGLTAFGIYLYTQIVEAREGDE